MRLRAAAFAVIITAGLLTFAPATTAHADDNFVQGNNAPDVYVPPDQAFIATPLLGGSDTKTLASDIVDIDEAETLDIVEMCITFHDTLDCSHPDPQNAIKLMWDRSSNTFTVEPEDTHVSVMPAGPNDANHSYANVDGNLAELNFRFKFSEVSREGDWKMRSVRAVDDHGVYGQEINIGSVDMEVRHFSAITTARDPVDFGYVPTFQTSTGINNDALDHSAGKLITNGPSDVTYRLDSNFVNFGADGVPGGTGADADIIIPNTANRDPDPNHPPAQQEFAYDCAPGATYSGTEVRVGSATDGDPPVDCETDITTSGTTEDGTTTVTQSTRLWNGWTGTDYGTPFQTYVTTGTTDAS